MGNLICIENQMSDVKRNNQQVAENKGDEHTKTNGKSIEGLNCKHVIEKVETTYEKSIHKHSKIGYCSKNPSLALNSVGEKDEAQSSPSKSKVLQI